VTTKLVFKYNSVLRLLSERLVTPEYRDTVVHKIKGLVRDLEKLLPNTEHSKLLHGFVELATNNVQWGPAWALWMFPFER